MKKTWLVLIISLLTVAEPPQVHAQQIFPSTESLIVFPMGHESTAKQGFALQQGPEKNLIGAYVQNPSPLNRFTVASLVLPFRAKVIKTLSPFNGIVAVAVPTGPTRSTLYLFSMDWGSAQTPARIVPGTMSNILIVLETELPEFKVLQAIESATQSAFRFLNPSAQYQTVNLPLRYASVHDGIKQFLSPLFSVEDALRLSGLCYQRQNCLNNIENYMRSRSP